MTTPNLEALLAADLRRPRGGSALSSAAKKEKMRRAAKASGLARTALARLYRDDFRDLYKQALVFVDAEAGPLADGGQTP